MQLNGPTKEGLTEGKKDSGPVAEPGDRPIFKGKKKESLWGAGFVFYYSVTLTANVVT